MITLHRIDSTDPLAHRKVSIGGTGYKKVLVDAPCSSERHIIHAQVASHASGRMAPEINNWRARSSKQLAKTQVDLLMTGPKAAKIRGKVMYATCSIEPMENDGVVEKIIATVGKELKKGAKWSINIGFINEPEDPELERILQRDWAERTKQGWIILPDHSSGGKWGPLFFTI